MQLGGRHAPPRSRADPFGDFTSDHNTVLGSLAQERQTQREKQETAKNAGNLLRRMQQQQKERHDEEDELSARSRYTEDSQQNHQQPSNNLQRLKESMANLSSSRNHHHHGGGDDEHENHNHHHHQNKNRISPSRGDFSSYFGNNNNKNQVSISPANSRSSADRDSLYGTPHAAGVGVGGGNNNNYTQQRGVSGSSASTPGGGGGGGAGLSSNTANHILRDMQGLKDSISRLEGHLMSDMKRRVESHAALQRTVELRVREIAETAEKKSQDRMVKLHHTLDNLTQRIAKLEGALAVEREKNARLVQELKYHSVRGLQEIRTQLSMERNARSERIAVAGRNFEQEVFRVEEQIAVSKRAREGLSEEVRDAIARAQVARAEHEDKLLQSLMSDIRSMKTKLEAETREREAGEEQLAGAMADLAQHLQAIE